MNNSEYNSLGNKVALIMANNSYSEIIWIGLFCISLLCFFWILISYWKNQSNIKEYILYASILTIITIGRLPHFSRGFIDGDEAIWITNALTLIHDTKFYFSEIINSVRFFSVVPLVFLYPIGINHTTCQLVVIIIFFLIIVLTIKILSINFEKKNVFLSITPFLLAISLLNTYGFIPYNSEHFSILVILLIVYVVLKINNKDINENIVSMTIVGILSFIAINCKFQSLLIVILINFYLLINLKNKLNIFFVIIGFLIAYLPFILISLSTNNIEIIAYFWIDNFYYALFGLNDDNKDKFLDELLTIFLIPDTKYYYLFSFLSLLYISTEILKSKLDFKQFLLYVILLTVSLYTVIAPQFLFLHYIFYFIFSYFLFFCYSVNIFLNCNNSSSLKLLYLFLCSILPSIHILYSGNISFRLSSEKLAYYNSQNFLLSLREKYLKDVSFPKFSILGWNNKYYTDGNFILGSSEMYTILFELDFPSSKYRYERFIINLENRLPEIFCIQAGKSLNDHHELSLILNKHYTLIAKESGDDFYILNCFIDNKV